MTAFVLKYIFILRSLLKINIYLRIHFSDSTHASCLGLIVRLPSSHHNKILRPPLNYLYCFLVEYEYNTSRHIQRGMARVHDHMLGVPVEVFCR